MALKKGRVGETVKNIKWKETTINSVTKNTNGYLTNKTKEVR
jgi:hypothetical protein